MFSITSSLIKSFRHQKIVAPQSAVSTKTEKSSVVDSAGTSHERSTPLTSQFLSDNSSGRKALALANTSLVDSKVVNELTAKIQTIKQTINKKQSALAVFQASPSKMYYLTRLIFAACEISAFICAIFSYADSHIVLFVLCILLGSLVLFFDVLGSNPAREYEFNLSTENLISATRILDSHSDINFEDLDAGNIYRQLISSKDQLTQYFECYQCMYEKAIKLIEIEEYFPVELTELIYQYAVCNGEITAINVINSFLDGIFNFIHQPSITALIKEYYNPYHINSFALKPKTETVRLSATMAIPSVKMLIAVTRRKTSHASVEVINVDDTSLHSHSVKTDTKLRC